MARGIASVERILLPICQGGWHRWHGSQEGCTRFLRPKLRGVQRTPEADHRILLGTARAAADKFDAAVQEALFELAEAVGWIAQRQR
jgi:hypothetical protein